MKDIQVKVIAEHGQATEMMAFLARLTQHGADIKGMDDIMNLKDKPASTKFIESLMRMEHHGTIKRFTPITVAIVGASRRFLAQARTNQVGFNYVSASLQYSDYTGKAQFVVPYALLEADAEGCATYLQNTPLTNEVPDEFKHYYSELYLNSCELAMNTYKELADATDNDTAGYAAPQGLRNILIMQGNIEAWMHFITLRSCNRNTNETQYVTLRIWEELLKTEGGEALFKWAGPDCLFGRCKEGRMCCGNPLSTASSAAQACGVTIPRYLLDTNWPLLKGE